MLTLPGEVSRSGSLRGGYSTADAGQGIEAHDTGERVYLALDHDPEILPVINKIDLPGSAARRNLVPKLRM